MTRLTFLLSVMSLGLAAGACGKKPEDDKAKAAKAQLIGKWNGKMNQRTGANLVQSSAVSLEFNESDQYQITETSKGNKAQGKYAVYPDQGSLNLLIDQSDFALFGLTAEPQNYKYAIAANATTLSLWYDNHSMDLTKDGAIGTTPQDTGTGTGTETADPSMITTGKWQGNDPTNDDVWVIKVSEKSASLTITHDGTVSTVNGTVYFPYTDKARKVTSGEMTVTSMVPSRTLSSLNLNYDFSKAAPVLSVVPLSTQGVQLTEVVMVRKP